MNVEIKKENIPKLVIATVITAVVYIPFLIGAGILLEKYGPSGRCDGWLCTSVAMVAGWILALTLRVRLGLAIYAYLFDKKDGAA